MVIVVKRKVTHAQFWLDSTQVAGRTPNDAGQKSAARRSPLIPSEPISGPCDEILEGQDQFCILPVTWRVEEFSWQAKLMERMLDAARNSRAWRW
jgi:hypothetical protein